MIFSEEMYNAMKYGYKFKILSGYTFNRANILKEYIEDLYKIKESHSKDDPMYIIAKLLMNSLYGRFAMNNELALHTIINNNEIDKMTANNNIKFTALDLENGYSLLTIIKDDNLLNGNTNLDISIPIAAAITAYSRIHMSPILADDRFILFYTDTDSAYLGDYLDAVYVGKNIGQMKLEVEFKEAVFLSPKAYAGITNDGKEIVKVKGFKNTIPYALLKSLLIKESKIDLFHDKWFKSFNSGEFIIKPDTIYTLMATQNKREFIYDENNKSNYLRSSSIIIPNKSNILYDIFNSPNVY